MIFWINDKNYKISMLLYISLVLSRWCKTYSIFTLLMWGLWISIFLKFRIPNVIVNTFKFNLFLGHGSVRVSNGVTRALQYRISIVSYLRFWKKECGLCKSIGMKEIRWRVLYHRLCYSLGVVYTFEIPQTLLVK